MWWWVDWSHPWHEAPEQGSMCSVPPQTASYFSWRPKVVKAASKLSQIIYVGGPLHSVGAKFVMMLQGIHSLTLYLSVVPDTAASDLSVLRASSTRHLTTWVVLLNLRTGYTVPPSPSGSTRNNRRNAVN
jgi:hypothetical protein